MPLVEPSKEETPAERLAKEARTRLSEMTNSLLLTLGNLMNYQHNNGANVTPEQFIKALGSDAKDYKFIVGSMRRMLLRMNPSLKAQLREMVPKKTKKAAK